MMHTAFPASIMDSLRYLSIDPKPSLCVLAIGVAAVALLHYLERWARRRTQRRTRELIDACDRERNART